jgi:antitoxin (DNA-binding transcriptional repressor) of toxin-antitoxin stability system
MRTVSIGDLQSQLVAHPKLATNGEDVVVCDSDKPIARIVPIDENDYSEQTRDLIARRQDGSYLFIRVDSSREYRSVSTDFVGCGAAFRRYSKSSIATRRHQRPEAADALQLAAALDEIEESSGSRPFFTADRKLHLAPRLNGMASNLIQKR